MIIHSPIISGSLTFANGATFTLPDNGIYSGSFSGSLQVHEVSSNIIPDANEAYDLGSATNRFRDIYLSNSTIKFGGGTIGVNANGEVILKDYSGNYIPLLSSEMKMIDSVTGEVVSLAVEGGQLKTSAVDSNGDPLPEPASNLSGSFTGSFVGDVFSNNGVVSGSEQVDVYGTTNFSTFSSSIADTFSGLSSDFDDLVNNPFTQSVSSVTITKNLVPSNSNLTLGTPELPFKDLYLSSASLYIDGQQVLSSNANELIITTDTNQSLKLVETGADTITLQTENGDITLASSGNGNIELDAPIQIAAGNKILSSDGNAVVFGDDLSVEGNISVTGTVDGVDVAALKTNVDAILSGSAADKDSFAEIVTLINSVDTTNDSVFAGFVTSSNAAQGIQDGRLTSLEIASSSAITRLDSLEGTDILVSLTGDVVGSGTITDLGDVTISTTIQPNSVALGTDTTGNYMSNVSAGNAGISISHTQGEGSTATISLVSGVVSGSSQITITESQISDLTHYTDSDVKTKLNAENVISSSAQITITESQISDLQSYVTTNSAQALGSATNVLTLSSNTLTLSRGDGSTDTVDLSAYLDEDSRAISSGTLNSVSGIVTFTRDDASTFTLDLSGLLDDTNLVTSVAGRTGVIVLTSSDVSEGSRLYYTDARVKTKLNVEAVVSGSATQVRSFLNVENGATADQTGTEIKTALFAESDTNNLTDTLLSKLNGIESGATADQTAGEIKTAYESNSNTNAFTDALLSKLNAIEAGATADQTAEEIQDIVGAMVSSNTEAGITVTYDDTAAKLNFSVATQSDNNFTSALLSKLNGIEAGADVTDATNVDAAGAVMNSDTSTAAMSFVIDEDTMASNTATKVPTQQSVKTYVDGKVAGLIASAPGALDTLDELALALGDDANFASTVTNSLATKANSSVTISAGNGLTGGGNLTANRTLSMSGTYSGNFAVTGGITATADVVAYASSDRRLKDNIVNIENPIEKVQKLNGVTWEWNDNADELQKSTPTVGVIAQEVEEVLPQLVNTRDNGYKAVDYAKLTGLLIEAIKEQQKQIDELKSKLN